LKTKGNKSAISGLTPARRRVDSHSFFDNSDVFPVGAESGAQAVVTAPQSGFDASRNADGKTAADGFATVNLNAANCESMTVDSRDRLKTIPSEQAGARKRDDKFRNSLGTGEYSSRGHPQILAVPHLATVRFGRAARVDPVFITAPPVTAGSATSDSNMTRKPFAEEAEMPSLRDCEEQSGR
jgi:hypothetical protein